MSLQLYNRYAIFIKLLSVQFTLVVTKHWRVNTHHHCVSHLSVTAYVITHVTVGRLSTLKLRKWLASDSLITVWVSDTQSLNVPFFPLVDALFFLRSVTVNSWFTLLHVHCIRGFSFISPPDRDYDLIESIFSYMLQAHWGKETCSSTYKRRSFCICSTIRPWA